MAKVTPKENFLMLPEQAHTPLISPYYAMMGDEYLGEVGHENHHGHGSSPAPSSRTAAMT